MELQPLLVVFNGYQQLFLLTGAFPDAIPHGATGLCSVSHPKVWDQLDGQGNVLSLCLSVCIYLSIYLMEMVA